MNKKDKKKIMDFVDSFFEKAIKESKAIITDEENNKYSFATEKTLELRKLKAWMKSELDLFLLFEGRKPRKRKRKKDDVAKISLPLITLTFLTGLLFLCLVLIDFIR